MHAQKGVLRVASLRHGGRSILNHGIGLQEDILQVKHAFLSDLRHVREQAEDYILKTEDAQSALLMI